MACLTSALPECTESLSMPHKFLLSVNASRRWVHVANMLDTPVSLISTTQPFVTFSSRRSRHASKSRSPGFWSCSRMRSMRMERPLNVEHTSRSLSCVLPSKRSMRTSWIYIARLFAPPRAVRLAAMNARYSAVASWRLQGPLPS